MAGFGISCVEPSFSAAAAVVNYSGIHVDKLIKITKTPPS
jgi:hypothetical protein